MEKFEPSVLRHRDWRARVSIKWLSGASLCACFIGALWAIVVPVRSQQNRPLEPDAPAAGTRGSRGGSKITQVQIDSVGSPTFEGRVFGGTGRYDRLLGHFPASSIPPERYGTQARYVDNVRAATERLQREGFLLPKDAERLLRQAGQRDLGLPKK